MKSDIEERIFSVYNFSKEEKVVFLKEFQNVRKETKTAVILAVVTGFLGGQFFYLGRYGLGILCVFASVTFIPFFFGLIHAFMLPNTVKKMNQLNANEIATRIVMSRKPSKKDSDQKKSASQTDSTVNQVPAERIIIREIVKIPCPYCSSLVENTSSNCPNCGGTLR